MSLPLVIEPKADLSPPSPISRSLAIAVVAASCGSLLLQSCIRVLELPYSIWNNAKLAPAIALWHGVALYPGPGAPVTDWVQGPVGALVFSLAAVGGSADGMLYLAGLLNLAFIIVPMVIVLRQQSEDLLAVTAVTTLLMAALLAVQCMFGTAFVLVLDSLALGFLLLALVALRGVAEPRAAVLAGLLMALAIWTKHTIVAGCAGVVLAEWLCHGRHRSAVGLTISTAIWAGLLGLAFSGCFGWDRLWFWMVKVPGSHAWVELATRQPRSPLQTFREVGWHLLPACGGLAAVLVAARLARRDVPPAARSLILIAACQLPASVAGYLKIGGSYNHLGIVACLVALAAAAMLVRLLDRQTRAAAAIAAMAAVLAASAGPSLSRSWEILTLLDHTPTDRAVEFARAHPRQAYFPWHPLATLVAEGRLDHLEYGLLDLSFAGRPPDRTLLLAGLPDRVEYIVYPESPFSRYVFNLLGENLVVSRGQSLPGFTVYSLTDTIRANRRPAQSP